VIVTRDVYRPPDRFDPSLKFVSADVLPAMFGFPRDMARVPAEVNRLTNQILVQYFDAEWKRAPSE
jgi:spermidine synthase